MALNNDIRVTIRRSLDKVSEEFGGSFDNESFEAFLHDLEEDPEIQVFYEAFYHEAYSNGMADANMER